jgi:toxin ParE1/3/4
MLTLVWRAKALADLETIFGFIADRDTAAADRLLSIIERCVERLPQYPFLYRTGRVEGTREAVVHPNYIVVYRVTADQIEIVNIVHARQNYP